MRDMRESLEIKEEKVKIQNKSASKKFCCTGLGCRRVINGKYKDRLAKYFVLTANAYEFALCDKCYESYKEFARTDKEAWKEYNKDNTCYHHDLSHEEFKDLMSCNQFINTTCEEYYSLRSARLCCLVGGCKKYLNILQQILDKYNFELDVKVDDRLYHRTFCRR